MKKAAKLTLKFEEVGIDDVGMVGGKNASLGEMIRELGPKGVKVPSGFIVTAAAYREFLEKTGLKKFIKNELQDLDTHDLKDLAKRGKIVRDAVRKTELPDDLKQKIVEGYADLEKRYGRNADVAVRSSATAEDLPGASFAGEHETYLGIRGAEEVILAVRSAMASLFTDRAISYRADKGFDHTKIALSVGIQKMVRSDLGVSGVMFTLDTESGFKDAIVINGSWGLGEMIVQGAVTPDEFWVWKKGLGVKGAKPLIDKRLGLKDEKMIYALEGRGVKQTKIVPTTPKERRSFVLSDKEALTLARWGLIIEEHYSKKHGRWTPMDTEWAKDGKTGELFLVQARPETIHADRDYSKVTEFKLLGRGAELARGASVGSKIAVGKARIILSPKNLGDFRKGEVLVTDKTDPDWEPIMKMASAIVTAKGGRTSHAAIVSRELGIPAVVGALRALDTIKTGETVTVDASGSDGIIYRGALKFKVTEHDTKKIQAPKTKIMVNVAIPETAFETSFLPNSGVGLAREEFIIASRIGIHPLALMNFKKLDKKVARAISKRTVGWEDKVKFYTDNLAYGIAKIGAAFYPKPVIVRFSDFKTNEYRTLLGGEAYEPQEENPMLGWRGASRYYEGTFKEAFKLECKAIRIVRGEMGLTNVIPMVPFCRTPEEGKKTLEIMAEGGLLTASTAKKAKKRSGNVMTPVYVMCEIPSNILQADEFLDIFDGMSIGSNDLTQLTLGLDRDSALVAKIANENSPAVKSLISDIIRKCRARKKYIGICGQGPSDYPDFAEFLVERGIESMSLNPDTVVQTTLRIAAKEKKLTQKRRK